MAFSIWMVAAAIIGAFIILRILMGGRSSPGARQGAWKKERAASLKIGKLQGEANKLQAIIRTAPSTKQREQAAKKLEKTLKQIERAHKTAEFNLKRA